MNDIIKYIDKYGDKSFEEEKFNIIDNVIFSQISYADFTDIVSNDETKISLQEAVNIFLNKKTKFLNHRRKNLLREIKDTNRYKNLMLSNYMYKLTEDEQFGAIAIDINEKLRCISYEGTDLTIVGWKEDFAMSYSFPIPAQKDAIDYLNKVGKRSKKIILTGHSKGGNLALVSGIYSNFIIKRKIIKIYSNDGPGLRQEEINSYRFKNIKNKYIKIVPKYSFFGLLLNNIDNKIVVDCNEKGLFSHSVFSWKIKDKEFIESKLSNSSIEFENKFSNWLKKYNYEQRKIFSNYIFSILENNNIQTTKELNKMDQNKLKNMFVNIKNIDPITKEMLSEFVLFIKNYYFNDLKQKTKKILNNENKK